MPKFVVRIVFSCMIFISGQALAWWETPHMLVAEIAYQHLTPETRAWADSLIQVHAKEYPKTNDFQTAAVWADDIKSEGNREYSSWHYVTLYFYETGEPMPTKADFPDAPHVSWAIEHDAKILSDGQAPLKEQAIALRRLIHWVGDIHQPMHSATQITPQNPKGDSGGTQFKLHKNAPASNLHGLWDSGMSGWVNLPRPLSRDDSAILREEALLLLAQYTPDSLGTRDPYLWALDGHALAKAHAYPGLEYKGMPSEAYLENGGDVSRMQIVLGGLRLARLLNEAYAAQP